MEEIFSISPFTKFIPCGNICFAFSVFLTKAVTSKPALINSFVTGMPIIPVAPITVIFLFILFIL